jgi:hypothetical protein
MQGVAKTPTSGQSKIARHIFKLSNLRQFKIGIHLCILTVIFVTSPFGDHVLSADNSQGTSHKHKWLIPVGAAAGFGVGLLIGFQEFDEAINSDQKIWTTAIAGGVIGGVVGWLLSRHTSQQKFDWRSGKPSQEFQITPAKTLGGQQIPPSLSDSLRQIYSENIDGIIHTQENSSGFR